MLSAVPAGKLATGAAATGGGRMRAEGPQGDRGGLASEGHCACPAENQGSLVCPGGLELLLGHWSATPG